MAATLKKFDFPEQHSRESHDWDTILDGGIRRFVKGKDFSGEPVNFATSCRTKGKQRGHAVKTAVEYEGEGDERKAVSVVVQADLETKVAKPKKKDDKKGKGKGKKDAKTKDDSKGDDNDDDDF